MPRYSDSNYAAVTRQRRYPIMIPTVVVADDTDVNWAGDVLEPDEIDISQHEAAVAPLLEEGELDADAIVVSPTGNSSSAATVASERRRREEGWNDLALDQFVDSVATAAAAAAANSGAPGASTTGAGGEPATPDAAAAAAAEESAQGGDGSGAS